MEGNNEIKMEEEIKMKEERKMKEIGDRNKKEMLGKMNEINYSRLRNFFKPFVLNISTEDCSLNSGSLDQIGQFNFNASANMGISFLCISCLACDSKSLNESFGSILINLDKLERISSNCSEVIFAYFNTSDSFFFNSSIAYSGVNSSTSKKSELMMMNLTGLFLKNDTEQKNKFFTLSHQVSETFQVLKIQRLDDFDSISFNLSNLSSETLSNSQSSSECSSNSSRINLCEYNSRDLSCANLFVNEPFFSNENAILASITSLIYLPLDSFANFSLTDLASFIQSLSVNVLSLVNFPSSLNSRVLFDSSLINSCFTNSEKLIQINLDILSFSSLSNAKVIEAIYNFPWDFNSSSFSSSSIFWIMTLRANSATFISGNCSLNFFNNSSGTDTVILNGFFDFDIFSFSSIYFNTSKDVKVYKICGGGLNKINVIDTLGKMENQIKIKRPCDCVTRKVSNFCPDNISNSNNNYLNVSNQEVKKRFK